MDKSVVIYIKLIEGTHTWVPVQATELQTNVYRIFDNPYFQYDDHTSIWEFFPGDTVRCIQEDNIIKASVLISSSFPNRAIHGLIFLIVSSLGRLSPEEIKKSEKEILELCASNNIFQKNHPLVKKWLAINCPLLSNPVGG